MRAGDGADDVERVLDVRHPVAHRLVQGVLQRAAAAFHRHDLRAEQLHPIDVRGLPPDVLAAHVHDALHAEARRHGSRRHAVLSRARLGDHARLAHSPREQRLADRVVDLVRARVIEVLALQVDLRAAEQFAPAPRVVDRARAADEVRELVLELGDELGIRAVALVRRAQFVERVHQRLGDEHAAVGAEVPALVGQVVHLHAAFRKIVADITCSHCGSLLVRPPDRVDEFLDARRALDARGLLDAAADIHRVRPHRLHGPHHVVAVEPAGEYHAAGAAGWNPRPVERAAAAAVGLGRRVEEQRRRRGKRRSQSSKSTPSAMRTARTYGAP